MFVLNLRRSEFGSIVCQTMALFAQDTVENSIRCVITVPEISLTNSWA